ncbi:reverse transcriptase domain-containing protein [Tanacetum coccineum]
MLLTNKYCPRTEVRKMEDEFYNLTIKGNDLKPYVRRFQELAVPCPNMVPNTQKLLEAFIGGLPRSIKGNVTTSKPQTLEEAINIAQRLMDQVTKHTLNRRQEAVKAYAATPAKNNSIVQFLGNVIDNQGIHVDPAKIEAVENWASPTSNYVKYPNSYDSAKLLAKIYQRFFENRKVFD